MNKLLVANWKQNKNLKEVKDWLAEFKILVDDTAIENVDVVICPPDPYLNVVNEFTEDYGWIFTGSQDISEYDQGSHTGEVGVLQLKDFVDFVIVGHSERSETRKQVIKKVEMCVSNKLIPIICFEKPEFLTEFEDISAYFLWEDPATISKGGEFKPKSLNEIKDGISDIIKNYSVGKGLLYGGSINKDNASGLGKIKNLSGGVSGSASLDAQHFYKIIKSFESINALR